MKKENSTHLSCVGIFIAIITYLISQTTFSIFLTELFNSTNSKNTFNYNILYRISENQWWNVLLIMISFMLSVVVFISLVSYKKLSKSIMKKTIYKLFQIYILCNVIVLCIIYPKHMLSKILKLL